MRRHLVRIAAVTALLTLSACSSSGDSSAGPGTPEPGASGRTGAADGAAADGPAYEGPDLPGLAAKPLWSVERKSTTDTSTTVFALGEGTVAIANVVGPEPSATPAYGTSSDSLRQQTVELRDVATGTVRKTLNVYGEVSGETWLGKPAVIVRGQQPRTKADDPTAEKPWLIEAYDERGERLGGGEERLSMHDSILQDGWILAPEGGSKEALSVRRVGDTGAGQRMNCSVTDACSYAIARGEVYVVGGGGAESKAMAAGTMFKYERAGDTSQTNGRTLVALDPATGARRWASDTLVRPAGAEPAGNTSADGPEVLGSLAGKIVISWAAAGSEDGRVVGLYDPVTGKPAGTGPTSPAGALFAVADPEGKIAVLATDRDKSRSTAWETASGQTLWQQTRGDDPLVPVSIVGGILWANSGNPVALDARTGNVVAKEPELALTAEESVPTPVGTRHAYTIVDRAVHVFAVQP
ncbi:hypothetical protein [Streptodolium elevatio]|uniref:PQQ-binding-like beta-propeller repeat protein n=1 Tax=Streptodolium elevatio TaxID=3157996 RepID=A0ABV3D9L3_9ACTN